MRAASASARLSWGETNTARPWARAAAMVKRGPAHLQLIVFWG